MRLCALFFAVPLLAMLFADEAGANVVCQVNNAGLDMGSAGSGTGAINYTCINYQTSPANFNLCVELGTPSSPGTIAQPAFPLPSSNKLDFNVYRDAAMAQIWSAGGPLAQSVSISAGVGASTSGNIPFYARIAPGQAPPPGNYHASFFNTLLGFFPGNSTSGNCRIQSQGNSGEQFTLPINASVPNDCQVTALGPADLGVVAASSSPVLGSTTIRVRCVTGTLYNIGLRPSNGSNVGSGELSGTGSNTDKVPYQLHSQSNTGPIWGNTASSSGAGNGVSGAGNGVDQSYPVFVTVPDSDYTPDTYRDTVRVTVHY